MLQMHNSAQDQAQWGLKVTRMTTAFPRIALSSQNVALSFFARKKKMFTSHLYRRLTKNKE
jgi:hypothetical protein